MEVDNLEMILLILEADRCKSDLVLQPLAKKSLYFVEHMSGSHITTLNNVHSLLELMVNK
jgi:hypothetical protein